MKLFFLIFLLLLNVSFASDEDSKLTLDLEIRSTIYQSNVQAQIFVAKEVKAIVEKSLESADYSEDEDLEILLQKVISSECCVRDHGLKPFLRNSVKDVIKEVREIARKEGVVIAVWLGVGEVLELLSPVVLTGLGQPQLIPIAEIILAPEANVPVILAVKKLIKRRKLIKLYGGKENFLKIKELRKLLDKDYGLDEDSVIFSESGHYFSVTKKFGIFQKIGSSLGIANKINPISLKKFLKKKNVWNEDLQKIKKSELESFLKSILIVAYVLKNEPQGHDLLLENFPELHFDQKQITTDHSVLDWANEFENIKTLNDLEQWSKKVPKEAKSLEVVLLWKQVFYPRLMEESTGMDFKNYRRWSKTLDAFAAKAELNPCEAWNEAWQMTFDSYLSVEKSGFVHQ